MRTTARWLRIIGLLALALGLGACSAVKLGYNNIDQVAYWWLDGYLDFDDTQTRRVRDDLARLHQWHRSNELPRVGQLLQRMEQLVPGEVTAEQACQLFEAVRERVNALGEQADSAVVAHALTLTQEQLTHLDKRFERNNADYRKEWVDVGATERRDKRFKQILERSEMVYGKLDEPQRAVLRQQVEQSIFDPRRILAERQRRQADLLQTLRKLQQPGLPLAEARTLMRGYFDRLQASPDADWRRHQEALTQEGCRFLAAGHNATSAAQRQAAVNRLRAYQRDVAELSAQR